MHYISPLHLAPQMLFPPDINCLAMRDVLKLFVAKAGLATHTCHPSTRKLEWGGGLKASLGYKVSETLSPNALYPSQIHRLYKLHDGVHLGSRRQLLGVSSQLLPCGSWGLSSDHQACQQGLDLLSTLTGQENILSLIIHRFSSSLHLHVQTYTFKMHSEVA